MDKVLCGAPCDTQAEIDNCLSAHLVIFTISIHRNLQLKDLLQLQMLHKCTTKVPQLLGYLKNKSLNDVNNVLSFTGLISSRGHGDLANNEVFAKVLRVIFN